MIKRRKFTTKTCTLKEVKDIQEMQHHCFRQAEQWDSVKLLLALVLLSE